jgi:hypothetical protein
MARPFLEWQVTERALDTYPEGDDSDNPPSNSLTRNASIASTRSVVSDAPIAALEPSADANTRLSGTKPAGSGRTVLRKQHSLRRRDSVCLHPIRVEVHHE